MGRPKRVQILTRAPAGPAGVAELWDGIDRILVFANRHRDPSASHHAHEVHRALTLLSEGASHYNLKAWPLAAIMAFRNFVAIVHRGGYYVRRCPRCDNWFLLKDRRRRTCYRKPCRQALAAQRQAAARRREYERQRRARARLKKDHCTI